MPSSIVLPPVSADLGVDLIAALRLRRSTREYDTDRGLPLDVLGRVLWAANGVNGPENKRTAPSAFGVNPVAIYVALPESAYRYDAVAHCLEVAVERDIRAGLCPDDWTSTGAASIILTGRSEGFPDFVTPGFATELLQGTAGCIAENVHLMAGALGLGTCMVGHMNADAVRNALGLDDREVPLYVMPLGYLKGA